MLPVDMRYWINGNLFTPTYFLYMINYVTNTKKYLVLQHTLIYMKKYAPRVQIIYEKETNRLTST